MVGFRALALSLLVASLLGIHASNTTGEADVQKGETDGGMKVSDFPLLSFYS